MQRLVCALVASLLASVACGCDPAPPLERSCNGEPVLVCAPYEYAEPRVASLAPSELRIADFEQFAQIRVELARCANAPAPHEVEIAAVVPDEAPADGGAMPVRVISLLTLRDGENGDAVAGDGVIEVQVVNPLVANVPPSTDIQLRFVARSTRIGGCAGGGLTIPYRTGPARM